MNDGPAEFCSAGPSCFGCKKKGVKQRGSDLRSA